MENNSFYDQKITVYGRSILPEYRGVSFQVVLTLLEAFAAGIGELLLFMKNIDSIRIGFNHLLFGDSSFSISDSDFSDIITSLLNAGLVNLKDKTLTLTDKGKQVLFSNINIDRSAYKNSALTIMKILGPID